MTTKTKRLLEILSLRGGWEGAMAQTILRQMPEEYETPRRKK